MLDQEVGRQTCVAVSSGETEFHALTLCAARLIFAKNLVEGFGFPPVEGPIAYSDSSAARGVAKRKGVGSSSIIKSEISGYNRPEWMDRRVSTRGCGSCFEGMRCHAMESAGGVSSWIVPSWTVSGVAARAHAPDLAG